MGMGRQEEWLLDNLEDLDVATIITVGSVMKLLSGELRTPPRWTGRLGIEWLCRFVQQPRATFRRYYVEPWRIVWVLTMQRWRQRA
jgi:N-acetylglucosaminyldiphosphoundecaprenol N-acetyl-beta-D-mannosaminyltransferase